jgi:guanylate kinase
LKKEIFGRIIVISAPSGAGKTSIIKEILIAFPELVFSISATTRKKRDNENEGVDYFFINEEDFISKINEGEFVEYEKFYDYYYGTYKSYINNNISEGKPVLLDVDVKGALSIKKIYPEAALIYILPPSLDILIERLKKRQTESEADLNKRVERAKMELSLKDKFDYFVVNKDLNLAILEVKEIINKILNKQRN